LDSYVHTKRLGVPFSPPVKFPPFIVWINTCRWLLIDLLANADFLPIFSGRYSDGEISPRFGEEEPLHVTLSYSRPLTVTGLISPLRAFPLYYEGYIGENDVTPSRYPYNIPSCSIETPPLGHGSCGFLRTSALLHPNAPGPFFLRTWTLSPLYRSERVFSMIHPSPRPFLSR